MLKTVDDAVADGFTHSWVCDLWQVSDDRVHRWRARRRSHGSLTDLAPGGAPVHSLRPDEVAEILAIVEEWGPVDGSHRKLAHRGSYQNRVWVSPSTLRRVMTENGLILPELPPRRREPKRELPEWLVWEPNRIWAWDVTHFGRANRCVFAIIDAVSRYWIDTLVSIEETSTQVQVIFDQALTDQGLVELITPERLELDLDDPERPILVAMSDNGPPMTSNATKQFMALMAIAQHHGRPHTLTPLVTKAAPTTISRTGIGIQHAATLLVAAGENIDRFSSERAFAKLCATAPLLFCVWVRRGDRARSPGIGSTLAATAKPTKRCI